MKVLTFIVCAAALSLSLSLLFFPPAFPPFPALGEICPLYPLAAAALGHYPGAQSQVGPLPLFCLPCLALCSFSDSRTGFLGEILFPWSHLSSHVGRQSNMGKGLEPFGDQSLLKQDSCHLDRDRWVQSISCVPVTPARSGTPTSWHFQAPTTLPFRRSRPPSPDALFLLGFSSLPSFSGYLLVSPDARLDSGNWECCEDDDKATAGEELTLEVRVEGQTDDTRGLFRGCQCNEEDKAEWLSLQVEAVSLLGGKLVQWLKAPRLKPDWRALSLSFGLTSCVPQFLYLSNGNNNSA